MSFGSCLRVLSSQSEMCRLSKLPYFIEYKMQWTEKSIFILRSTSYEKQVVNYTMAHN